jgi:hypothetical protein
VCEFLPALLSSLDYLRELLYTRSERDAVQHYEFRENRYSENHTSLKGAHEILVLKNYIFLPSSIQFVTGSQQKALCANFVKIAQSRLCFTEVRK